MEYVALRFSLFDDANDTQACAVSGRQLDQSYSTVCFQQYLS
jgi:hypothetical protein